MITAQRIKDLGQELDIELRIAHAAPFDRDLDALRDQIRKGLFLNPERWNDEAVRDFYDPRTLLHSARSIIAGCLGFLTRQDADPSIAGKPYGVVAKYTQRNYYKELRKRLQKVGKFLRKEYGADHVVRVCGSIAEKPIARRCGIGYFGKHSVIINQAHGSWIVLGEIVTDLEIEPDRALDAGCGACRECIDACPTGALIEPYILDRNRCIQALTNYTGFIPAEIADAWGNRIYGCTACQDACPVNKMVKPAPPRTEIGVVGQYLPLLDTLEMDEKKYRRTYADNQVSARWIDFSAIKRNALFCLGSIRDEKTVPAVRKYAKCRDPLLASAARWALGKFR
jgi:epoxyqueuosine reductase